MFGLNEVPNLLSDGVALKRFVTREPISIFSQIKNAKDEEKKELNQLLEILRKKLPEGFKIGAAVGEGDCFFDSVAQGLNELKDKGLITGSKGFSVKSLRESCKQYAQQVDQSKEGSWLDNALKVEIEELCEYIPRIEFTAEDIKNASSGSEIKILKLENVIWGRPEIEGKMICEKYGIKVRIIELRDEEIDGVHVTKGKVGTGNNIIYIVNYRNHFVPLLSNIKKDIKRSIKVSREEAYDDVIGSNSNNISQSYISILLRDVENSSHKQSSHSRSSGKENREIGVSSGKRKRSVTDKDSKVPKRAHIDINVTNNEDSEFSSDLQDTPGQDELDNTFQTKQCIPHHLIGLMYRLDLSVLCSLRKSIYEHKYPSLSLVFEDSEIDKFSSIVLRYEKKSIHIQIENVDKYYIDNDIGYARLFIKEKRGSYIDNCFNSFVEHRISKLDSSSNNIEYLIIYTNSGLDLTEEKELKQRRSRNFYPFKFDSMNIEECGILKDFLFTNDNIQGRGFYQFSQNKTTRGELLKRLEFSPAMQKVIKGREFSQECEREIKEAFLDKLVFAVNQPNREELNSIVKSEIAKDSKVQADYMTLQERILRDLTTPEKHKKLGNFIPEIIYEFNLLISFLHDMFLRKNISSIDSKNNGVSNDITIYYEDKITYIKAHNADSSIGYSQLFPSKQQKGKNTFSIDKYFALFIEESEKDKNIECFIAYTNTGLDLTEEKRLKKGQSRDFYPLKFDSMDIEKKEYKILKDCSCINENGLYQISQEETARKKLLSLLTLLPSLQKEKGKLSNEKEIKEKFLDKLMFAVDQPNRENLNSVIRNEIDKSNVPYNHEELHEIALRWSESHELGPITGKIMEKLLEDIKNNRSSYQRTQNKNNNEERQFAKSVVGKEGRPAFYQFLGFLSKEKGIKCLEVLKRKGISLVSMSSVLHGAGANAAKAFKDLYDLWFDKQGNKTQYLKTLEENRINLPNMSSILSGARANAAKAFKDLYDLWFDEGGNKTQYLKTLEENGINLPNMSNVLNGAGANAAKAFKDLYDLWFDKQGNKTQYLKTLEENGVNLPNVSSILGGAGVNAAQAFKGLYKLWFNKQGNKTQYLKTLEENRINLSNMSSILNGTGANAAKVFKDLYDLWFDKQGNKTQYLKTLEENGVNLPNVSSILHRARANAAQAFKGLYKLWFDEQGNKTQYLKALEKEGINISDISNILHGAGSKAPQAFEDLYDLWFDKQGNKTQYLKTLEENGVNLPNVSSILGGAGVNAAQAFKGLYKLWFNKQGNKTQHLKTLEENRINLPNMSSILSKAGANASKASKDLYDLWLDKEGNKTQYLKTLEENRINLPNMSSILNGAGANAAQAFKDLYDLWFDKQGNKTQYLKTLEENRINLSNMSSILNGTGANAAKVFKDLYDLWFDKQGNKTQHLKTLEENRINLPNMSSILNGAGANAAQAFKDLYDLWFDKQGNKTQYLKTLEENRINLANISGILSKAGANASKAFKDLYDLWFDEQGNKTQYLKTLEENRINLTNISSILGGAGVNAAQAFKGLYKLWFDKQGNKTQHLKTLEENRINLPNMSSILNGAGANAAQAFKDLYDLWFDKQGNKTQYLKTLEENRINLANISGILSKAGANASKAFKDLYDLWFDEQGNKTQYLKTLEENRINLTNISSILGGAGVNAAQAFKGLYDLWFDEQGNKEQHLKHFTEKRNKGRNFTISNLSGILGGAGAKASNAFKELHDVCFNDNGKETELLNNFYDVGFKPGNLSSMLCGSGSKASNAFKELHDVCFNDNGKETELLNNFYDVGFKPGNLSSMLCGSGSRASHRLKKFHNTLFDDTGKETGLLSDFRKIGLNPQNLCNILSASVSSLEQFHDFCSTEEAKAYLIHFSQGGFTINNLSNILHGARASICSALKNFHNVCFDEQGNNTQLLNDFHSVGFTTSHLSTILCMAGNNSASILKNFHKSCFNERNYLSHFLTEKKLFTPKDISYMLGRIGISVCSTFKNLHDLCFDEVGNRKSYLDDLIKNKQKKVNRMPDALYRKEILNILYKEVRKPYFTVSDEQSVEDKVINTDLESNSLFSIAEQGSDSLQQNSSEITEKKQIDQSNNRKDHEATSTVADGSESLPSKQGRKKKQIQLVYHNKEIFSYLLQFAPLIESVKQGLYLPSFKERGIKIDGKCIAMTRGLSQALFLQSNRSFLSNLKTSTEVYEHIAQGKQVSKREEKEVFTFSKLLDSFEQQLGSHTDSLPSSLVHTKNYKILEDLSHYIAGIKDDFAVHLVTSDHVIAIYRIGDNYAYFDSNTAFVSGLKSVDQFMQVVEKAIKFAGYKVEEKGFLVEHFDVDKANNLLSDEDRQVLTREIKTECQLLAKQDKELGLIKVNGRKLSRVQLYDFGTKINVEGGVPLLINAEMSLSSKKFQDHLDRKEVSMTAREYLDHLKDSKNVEEVIQTTKAIPFEGSKREIEEAEKTRKSKGFSLEQLVKGAINYILATVALTSRAEAKKPESYLSGVTVDTQMSRVLK